MEKVLKKKIENHIMGIGKYKDILIKTSDPIKADELLQQLGVLMSGGGRGDKNSYNKDDKGNYKARVLNGDVDYLKFVIENQGYNFIEVIETP